MDLRKKILDNQASRLKEIVENSKPKTSSHTRFIAVTSGKGGVGKSTFSANFAHILSGYGYKVALFDADIGLANLDVVLNVRARKNILHVLKGQCELSEILIQINPNLILIPGDSGDEILKYNDEFIYDKFSAQSAILDDLDFMIIDTGAGIGGTIQLFLEACDEVIVVTVPDPSSITDSYAMIKVGSKVRNSFLMVLNMVKSQKEAENIFAKIKKVADMNIGRDLSLEFLGKLSYHKIISRSIRQRTLFTQEYPSSYLSDDIHNIVKDLIFRLENKTLINNSTRGFGGFFRRILEQF